MHATRQADSQQPLSLLQSAYILCLSSRFRLNAPAADCHNEQSINTYATAAGTGRAHDEANAPASMIATHCNTSQHNTKHSFHSIQQQQMSLLQKRTFLFCLSPHTTLHTPRSNKTKALWWCDSKTHTHSS